MSIEDLIANYGYAAILIGTFLEGETILILGGFAAHRGYLQLPWVMLCAFLGTLLGDQLYFHVGRVKGKSFLERRPGWKSKADKVLPLLEKHQTWLILAFRFMYGIRTVTPFLIGTSGVSPWRFLLLNSIGALFWSTLIGTLGYLFGQTMEVLIGNLKRYEFWLFAVIAGAGLVFWSAHLIGRRAAANKSSKPTA